MATPVWLDLPRVEATADRQAALSKAVLGWLTSASVEAVLRGVRPSTSLVSVVSGAISSGATRLQIEDGYIDPDYRDEFAQFYSRTFQPHPDRCQRLHFWDAATSPALYVGFCVLRPTRSKPVGRTMIRPRTEDFQFVSCSAEAVVNHVGKRTAVQAFPFMEQDEQYARCAHVAAWSVAYYHHLVHKTPRRFLSSIADGASKRVSIWRTFPSGGLSEEQLNASLQSMAFDPLVYRVGSLGLVGETPEAVACRYLNSRIPVMLTYPGHVAILVGYGRDTNGDIFFIQSDESTSPYRRVYRATDPKPWTHLIVPLPGRIYMSGSAAERVGKSTLLSLLQYPENEGLAQYLDQARRPLRLRSYAIKGTDYKANLEARAVDPGVAAFHRLRSLSNWVWVVELQDPVAAKDNSRCVIGEVVIDATSHEEYPNVVSAHVFSTFYEFKGPGSLPEAWHSEKPGDTLNESGSSIHDARNAKPEAHGMPVPRRIRITKVGAWIRRHRADRNFKARIGNTVELEQPVLPAVSSSPVADGRHEAELAPQV